MSSTGLNSALHTQLLSLATLVDRAILERHSADPVAPTAASHQLAELLREASKPRPKDARALLLTALAHAELNRQDLPALERLLTGDDPAATPRLESLAVSLEAVREDVAARMLER